MNDKNDGVGDSKSQNTTNRQTAFLFCSAVVILGLFIFTCMFVMQARRTKPTSTALLRCTSNFRNLGFAIMMYINDHPDSQMPSPAELAQPKSGLRPQDLYCCWNNSSTNPPPKDYIFLAEGQPKSWFKDKTRIVAYEKPGHHSGESPVLFADGHVDRMKDDQLYKIIVELNAGRNPPFVQPVKQP